MMEHTNKPNKSAAMETHTNDSSTRGAKKGARAAAAAAEAAEEEQSRDASSTTETGVGDSSVRTSEHGVGPDDVLLGRGGATNSHEGNRKFRTIVAEHQQEYLKARKREKVVIARQIVAIVHTNGGRFLKRTENAQNWIEVPDKRAQEKTSQALREGLDVRNKTIRPNKMIKEVRPTAQQQAKQSGNQVPGKVKINAPHFSPNSTVSHQLQQQYHYHPYVQNNGPLLMPVFTDGVSSVQPVFLHHQSSSVITTQKDVKDAYEV